MARVRGPSYLTCFYCGRRTKSKYQPGTRDFLCPNCDATNYLDENGEITDPPVATEREAPATMIYAAAAARTSSSPPPPQTQADSIFCAACLKNQRLFAASLAQYLPDDPADPEHDALERDYYRYRRGLEKRYPQVCGDCAGKVDRRIRQAGFTAKTDHLRRMMERSSGGRTARRRTPLDLADALGRWLWRGGLALQLLWHLRVVADVLRREGNGMRDPDDGGLLVVLLRGVQSVVGVLPSADLLIRASIMASILCVWWNPHFVQVNRGFTRHLLGFTQWYSFQGLIVFFRFIFRAVLDIKGGKAHSRDAQLSAHLVMAAVMSLIYNQAGRSIKVNTTALFDSGHGSVSPVTGSSPKRRKREDAMTFSDLLNEALDTPAASPQKDAASYPYENQLPPPRVPDYSAEGTTGSTAPFNSLSLHDAPPRPPPASDYGDEMDWTPTTSPHRAFKDNSPGQGNRSFGHAPTQPESGAFWYKVPSAPAAPAKRMRNPRVPIVRAEAGNQHSKPFFGQDGRRQAKQAAEDQQGIDFNQPKFFAEEKKEDDDANTLADLLGKSFNLSQEAGQREKASAKPSMWNTRRNKAGNSRTQSQSPVQPLILASLLLIWAITTYAPVAVVVPHATEARLACLSIAGVIALRTTGDDDADENGTAEAIALLGSALGVAELAALCWVGWETWMGTPALEAYGAGVLAVMLGHHVWDWAV